MNTDPQKSPFSYWTRTARLRVYRHGRFQQHFCIQQLWISDSGKEKWEDIEEFIEPEPPKGPSLWSRITAWWNRKVQIK